MAIDWNQFLSLLKKLFLYKSSTTKVPIKNTSWEEIIWAALAFLYDEKNIEWDPQSHDKSADIIARLDDEDIRISAKAGKIKNERINISSYRLTTFTSLNSMLYFISRQHSLFNYYLICAREEMTDGMKYSVYRVSSARLAPRWFLSHRNWERTQKFYRLKKGLNFEAKIVFKMSNQLWYTIPKNYFISAEIVLSDLFIPYNEMGRGMIRFLKDNIRE